MRAEFSKFSYGYALTEGFVRNLGAGLTAAPTFPSLREEGRRGGFDVAIGAPVAPIFLQFKVPRVMVRRSRLIPPGFRPPYYRADLARRDQSRQHALLLALCRRSPLVYYATPMFHTVTELNRLYTNRQVVGSSLYISPRAIGPLPDADPHHIAYHPRHPEVWFCSEPRALQALHGGEITEPLHESWNAAALAEDEIAGRVWHDLVESVRDGLSPQAADDLAAHGLPEDPGDAVAKLGYIARTFFDSALLLMRPATAPRLGRSSEGG